jgi:glyoxylase-like metal-dependent hydrolase (beta-lactamase superfamily II)
MTPSAPVTVVNVGYRSTNYWVVSASWRLLRERGATRVYPAHGPVRALEVYSI